MPCAGSSFFFLFPPFVRGLSSGLGVFVVPTPWNHVNLCKVEIRGPAIEPLMVSVAYFTALQSHLCCSLEKDWQLHQHAGSSSQGYACSTRHDHINMGTCWQYSPGSGGLFPPELSVAAHAIAPEFICPGSADLVALMLTVLGSGTVEFSAPVPHFSSSWTN